MKAKLSLIIAGAAAVSVSMQAQVAFDGDYSQDFDTLATTGTGATANTWEDNTTLTGWYSSRTTYNAGTGSSGTGALYSFGTGTQTDRALGSVGSSSTGTVSYGVRLQNTSGGTLEGITVSYTGEQWRSGGSSSAAQSVSFAYNIGIDLSLGAVNGWTSASDLDFSSPRFLIPAGALDGNGIANREDFSVTLNGVSLAPGQELFLRWSDINHPENDHGLSIDNFNVSALTVVPEPSTWVLLGGGLAFLANRLRRRN